MRKYTIVQASGRYQLLAVSHQVSAIRHQLLADLFLIEEPVPGVNGSNLGLFYWLLKADC